MTKTITELQPMIYGDLFARTSRRRCKQRRVADIARKVIVPIYVLVGLMIVFDAGALPWQIQFWMMFLPFFLLGEAVVIALTSELNRPVKAAFESSRATNWLDQFETTLATRKAVMGKPLIDPVLTRLAASTENRIDKVSRDLACLES